VEEDITEHHKLAAVHPEKDRPLFKQLFAWELTFEDPRWMLKREYQ